MANLCIDAAWQPGCHPWPCFLTCYEFCVVFTDMSVMSWVAQRVNLFLMCLRQHPPSPPHSANNEGAVSCLVWNICFFPHRIGWGRRTGVYFISNFITFDPPSITVLLVAGLLRHYSCTIELTLWWCASHWILIHSQNHVAITALWFKNIFCVTPQRNLHHRHSLPQPSDPHLAAILLSISKDWLFRTFHIKRTL